MGDSSSEDEEVESQRELLNFPSESEDADTEDDENIQATSAKDGESIPTPELVLDEVDNLKTFTMS